MNSDTNITTQQSPKTLTGNLRALAREIVRWSNVRVEALRQRVAEDRKRFEERSRNGASHSGHAATSAS